MECEGLAREIVMTPIGIRLSSLERFKLSRKIKVTC